MGQGTGKGGGSIQVFHDVPLGGAFSWGGVRAGQD